MGRFLSSLGIGSAEVDLVLPKTKVRQGESVDASIEVTGGSDEQQVDAIYVALQTRYLTGDGDREVGTIMDQQVVEPFTIGPDEERTIDGALKIPHRTPVTMGDTEVWLRTGLDISMAVDPKDKDLVMVEPSERVQTLLDALEELGFVRREAENIADPGGHFAPGESFVQEFEYVPSAGPFADDFDEVEVIPQPSADGVNVFMEVDHDANFLRELTDTDEVDVQFSYRTTDPSELAGKVSTVLERHV